MCCRDMPVGSGLGVTTAIGGVSLVGISSIAGDLEESSSGTFWLYID